MKRIVTPANSQESSWMYNGYDCCLTLELYNKLNRSLPPAIQKTYQASLDRIAPIMEMSLRGIHVNQRELISTQAAISEKLTRVEANYNRLCEEVFGRRFLATSWQQVSSLLYVHMGIRDRGTRKAQLERVATSNWIARPLIAHILCIRDLRKQLSFLAAELTPSNRLMYSLNVAGTESGRLSCRKSVFGYGTNAQTVDKRHRKPFVADKDFTLVEIDLMQADSRNVGAICYSIFGDDSYLRACEQTDLHSAVVQMVWGSVDPHAEYKFHKTYRQFAKNAGHGSNYMGSPRGVAQITGIPANLIKQFQELYFERFPVIREWHKWTRAELRKTGAITTLFGRHRYFNDRLWDDGTVREAVAYQGQSMTAEQIDRGIMNVWREFPQIELLLQVHDSILMQVPTAELDILPNVVKSMQAPLTIRDREFCVPLEVATGQSWGAMQEWTG